MRIVAITSRINDIVQPTQAVIASEPELQAILAQCRTKQGIVTAIISDYYWCPIEVTFETGEVYYFEQGDLE